MRQAWKAVALLATVAMLASCTGTHKGSTKPSATPTPATKPLAVSPTTSTELNLPGGGTLTIPVGAVSTTGTIADSVIPAPAPAPAGLPIDGDVYQIELSGTQLISTATLTLPADSPPINGQPGPAETIVYYDTSTNAWTPVDSTYDAAAKTVTAQVTHFSIYTKVIERVATDLTSEVTDQFKKTFGVNDTAQQPVCPGADQAKSLGITAATPSTGSLLKWCIGYQNGEGLLKVADDRPFAVQYNFPAAWTATDDSWPPVDQAIYDGFAKLITTTPKGIKAAIIGPGDVEDFAIPAGDSGISGAIPTPPAYLAADLSYVLETITTVNEAVPFKVALTTAKVVDAIGKMLSAVSCLTSVQGLMKDDVSTASGALDVFKQAFNIASGCVDDGWAAAYGATGAAWGIVLSIVAWLMDGIKLVEAGIGAALETDIYYQGYDITVTTPAAPVNDGKWTDSSLTATTHSLGAATLDMSLAQIQVAAGVTLKPVGDGEYDPVGLAVSTPFAGHGTTAGTFGCFGAFAQANAPSVTTTDGFTLGGSVAQLKQIYGSRLQYTAGSPGGEYASDGWYVSDSAGTLFFQTAADPNTIARLSVERTANSPFHC